MDQPARESSSSPDLVERLRDMAHNVLIEDDDWMLSFTKLPAEWRIFVRDGIAPLLREAAATLEAVGGVPEQPFAEDSADRLALIQRAKETIVSHESAPMATLVHELGDALEYAEGYINSQQETIDAYATTHVALWQFTKTSDTRALTRSYGVSLMRQFLGS